MVDQSESVWVVYESARVLQVIRQFGYNIRSSFFRTSSPNVTSGITTQSSLRTSVMHYNTIESQTEANTSDGAAASKWVPVQLWCKLLGLFFSASPILYCFIFPSARLVLLCIRPYWILPSLDQRVTSHAAAFGGNHSDEHETEMLKSIYNSTMIVSHTACNAASQKTDRRNLQVSVR